MLGSIIGAVGNLVGGLIGKSSQEKALEQQNAIAQQNIALQKEFAQNAIQWKAADAQAAGIHPYYAMGATTTSFNPVSVGHVGGNPLGEGLAAMGQDLGRAVTKSQTPEQRQDVVGKQAAALSLERGTLENELLKTRIASERAKLTADQVGPAFPTQNNYEIPGQASTNLIKPKPLEVAPSNPAQPSGEGGAIADIGYARTKTGWAPVPSKDVKERIEDQLIPEAMWALRNHIMPTFQRNQAPPPFAAPAGQKWIFNPFVQEYQLINRASVPRGFLGARR